VDVFQLDILFIPIHLGNHWSLCAVKVQERTLTYYDSMGGSNEDALQVIVLFDLRLHPFLQFILRMSNLE